MPVLMGMGVRRARPPCCPLRRHQLRGWLSQRADTQPPKQQEALCREGLWTSHQHATRSGAVPVHTVLLFFEKEKQRGVQPSFLRRVYSEYFLVLGMRQQCHFVREVLTETIYCVIILCHFCHFGSYLVFNWDRRRMFFI